VCWWMWTVNHLTLDCTFFGTIWQLVRNWLGVHSVHSLDPSILADHFLQLGSSSSYAKSRSSFMFLIWFASTWVIWNEKNDMIIRGK